MVKKFEGCVHLIIKNGKVVNVYTHVSDFTKNGVIHFKGDKIYTFSEFKESHPNDYSELKPRKKKVIISDY